ncbi:MAG: DUF3048 domain-containing protein [Anaerolineaceae bacterium]|jgi:hypothetical protein|nr:MAG: DUF3048 domain-containing protein [Anaerolineaceae bacterium]
MKKYTLIVLLLVVLLAACSSGAASTVKEAPTLTATEPAPTNTPGPTFTVTPDYPPEGIGPVDFPTNVNPLTGLEVADAQSLAERVVAVKIENLPREHRPQWGLNAADLVYEYYTEFGSTRFVALYHGMAPEKVGPVRSARFFDIHVVQSYKAVFLFGSAYSAVYSRMWNSDISSRLVVEGSSTYPALYRQAVNGENMLFANLTQLPAALTKVGIDNSQQDLSGMFFRKTLDVSGSSATQVTIHFSNAIYNRWDYDSSTGKYLRSVDQSNAASAAEENYALLTDQATGEAISADNVVILFVPYSYYVKNATEEVMEVKMVGTGDALIARDGQIFPVYWKRETTSSMLTLVDADGNAFPFKPGNTWFEVVGTSSQRVQEGNSWRITHAIP